MTTENNDELISVREAAKECGRNMETVRRWIWSGKLPARKLGNQLFIKRRDLASYCRLSVRSLPAKVAEKAVREYNAKVRITEKPKNKAEFIKKSRNLRQQIRVRIGRDFTDDEIVGEIHRMREERMNQIEQSIKETAEAVRKREALLNFIKKARAIRNEIHARTGEVFNAEAMIRELREEREHELE